MGIYLFLPFFVWLFSKNKYYGLSLSMIVVICTAIAQIPIAFYYQLPANHYVDPLYERPNGSNRDWSTVWKMSGLISVYFCGTSLAFFMVIIDEKVKDFAVKKWQYFALMMFSGFIFLSLVCWPFQDLRDAPAVRWSAAANSWYSAFYKTAWVKLPCFEMFSGMFF